MLQQVGVCQRERERSILFSMRTETVMKELVDIFLYVSHSISFHLDDSECRLSPSVPSIQKEAAYEGMETKHGEIKVTHSEGVRRCSISYFGQM